MAGGKPACLVLRLIPASLCITTGTNVPVVLASVVLAFCPNCYYLYLRNKETELLPPDAFSKRKVEKNAFFLALTLTTKTVARKLRKNSRPWKGINFNN